MNYQKICIGIGIPFIIVNNYGRNWYKERHFFNNTLMSANSRSYIRNVKLTRMTLKQDWDFLNKTDFKLDIDKHLLKTEIQALPDIKHVDIVKKLLNHKHI